MIAVFFAAVATVVLAAVAVVFVVIPSFPDEVWTYVLGISQYLQAGANFLACFCYWDIVGKCIVFLLAWTAVLYTYKALMWVFRKVPMFGVSD